MASTNPFAHDPDRSEIWHILVQEDIEAFVAADFDRSRPRFDEAVFVGYDAKRSRNPDAWVVGFPSLDAYARLWTEQAKLFQSVRLAHGQDKAEFLFGLTDLSQIEITADRAIAHKKFNGRALTEQGTWMECLWQTLYLLRKTAGLWKITGFVGYLPYDMGGSCHSRRQRPLKRQPENARQHPTAGPYSPALIVERGRQVAISGQGPIDVATGKIVGTTIQEQSRLTLENCARQLAEAGATLDDVYQVRVYLSDMNEWAAFNEVYKQFMKPPYPVRTAIQAVLWGGMKVEIDMTAMIP